MSEKDIEKRKEQVVSFLFKNKSILIVLALIIILSLSFYTRTVNIENLKDITTGDYTLGPDLDPFLFLRYSENIIENGKLMEYDNMRFVPLGYDTSRELLGLPYMMAYFHNFINLFSDTTINYSAVIFPAFMFVLTALAFFLFINKVFEENKNGGTIALISTALLIVSTSLVARTVAGIPEKESVGFFFLFLSFYFLISSWKSKKIKNTFILSSLAGISTALMALSWGGWRAYVLTPVAVFFIICFFLNQINKKEFFIYSSWFIISIFLTLSFTARNSLISLITSPISGIAFMVFFLLLTDFIIANTKIKNIKFLKNLRSKYPEKLISFIIFLILIFILATFILGISFIPDFIEKIVFSLKQPYSDRLSFTVAENRQPYYTTWKGNFGPIIRGIPLFFWLFFVGSILLAYNAIKKIELKGRLILISSYILFLFGLVFSRYSSSSIFNGENGISRIIYFGSLFLILFAFSYLYYKYYKEKKLSEFSKINYPYLFLLVYFFISIIGARSAVRLIMALAPPATAMAGYLPVAILQKIKNKKDMVRSILIILSIIVLIATSFTFYKNYQSTIGQAKAMVPSSYTNQWQLAMSWVKENTSQDAVFSHWWDYGYWIQTMGKRATILDGGNSIAYWNHLLGRHVLTGHSEQEALEFLYPHNATHLLIDSTEIGKYAAYSSIGSNENYDRYSQMPTFHLDESQTRETKNKTTYAFIGNMFLDQDYTLKTEQGQKFFPQRKAGIPGVLLTIDNQNNIEQPEVIFIYQNQQYNIPLKCVYIDDKKYDFENGYGGCLYIVPKVTVNGINKIGSALFISEKSMKANWIKFYLFDETENFNLVHKEQNLYVQSLQQQGYDISDLVYYGGIQGPIKIWEITYPQDIEYHKEYLSKEYPPELRQAKDVF